MLFPVMSQALDDLEIEYAAISQGAEAVLGRAAAGGMEMKVYQIDE